jgi:formylglycine-generating enzyme
MALALPLGAACAALVSLPDVPGIEDAGTTLDVVPLDHASAPHDAGANRHVGSSGSGSEHSRVDASVDARKHPLESGGTDAPHRTDAPTCAELCASDQCSDSGCLGSTTVAKSCVVDAGDHGVCGVGDAQGACCESDEVQGGTFFRTYDPSDGGVTRARDGGPTGEANPATVSGFRLDTYLVTVGRFRPFVAAVLADGGFAPEAGAGRHTYLNGGSGLASVGDAGDTYEQGWNASFEANVAPTSSNLTYCSTAALYPYATWTPAPGPNEDRPINCVNWYEAYAFCIWDGGFLPSEAEYEYAAAGGAEQREYAWGETPPGTMNEYAIYGCDYPSMSATCSGVMNLAPVGSAPMGMGRWGQVDLAGEVWEWQLDTYASTYTNPCVDCAFLGPSVTRVIRGDAFGGALVNLLPGSRTDVSPTSRGGNIGVRCARSP